MKNNKNEIRISLCEFTNRKVLQIKDNSEVNGWICLHDDTFEEEIENILKFKYNIQIKIKVN